MDEPTPEIMIHKNMVVGNISVAYAIDGKRGLRGVEVLRAVRDGPGRCCHLREATVGVRRRSRSSGVLPVQSRMTAAEMGSDLLDEYSWAMGSGVDFPAGNHPSRAGVCQPLEGQRIFSVQDLHVLG